jgi:hypothetical protein
MTEAEFDAAEKTLLDRLDTIREGEASREEEDDDEMVVIRKKRVAK